MKPKIIVEDWKCPEEVIEQLIKAIKKLGGHVYNLPTCIGSDTYGYIVHDKKLTKKEINKIDRDFFDY